MMPRGRGCSRRFLSNQALSEKRRPKPQLEHVWKASNPHLTLTRVSLHSRNKELKRRLILQNREQPVFLRLREVIAPCGQKIDFEDNGLQCVMQLAHST
mmetsp:Transcript_75382/g.157088  ORF Transcript_75382/g.157088 Transcript_75382/m.157088 type:complete len:99 (+) Transcript_75382:548-844(+)